MSEQDRHDRLLAVTEANGRQIAALTDAVRMLAENCQALALSVAALLGEEMGEPPHPDADEPDPLSTFDD